MYKPFSYWEKAPSRIIYYYTWFKLQDLQQGSSWLIQDRRPLNTDDGMMECLINEMGLGFLSKPFVRLCLSLCSLSFLKELCTVMKPLLVLLKFHVFEYLYPKHSLNKNRQWNFTISSRQAHAFNANNARKIWIHRNHVEVDPSFSLWESVAQREIFTSHMFWIL